MSAGLDVGDSRLSRSRRRISGPLSTWRPSESLEWATLPKNAPRGVRRGQTSFVAERPVGCSGKASQKPKPSEPAATLFRTTLSGLVIQNVAGELSLGSRRCPWRPPGSEAEVAGEHVVVFGPVFEEVPVTNVVEADVVLDLEPVRAVDHDAAVEGVVHAGVLEVGLRAGVAEHVEVDRVAPEDVLLAHPVELDPFEPRGALVGRAVPSPCS